MLDLHLFVLYLFTYGVIIYRGGATPYNKSGVCNLAIPVHGARCTPNTPTSLRNLTTAEVETTPKQENNTRGTLPLSLANLSSFSKTDHSRVLISLILINMPFVFKRITHRERSDVPAFQTPTMTPITASLSKIR